MAATSGIFIYWEIACYEVLWYLYLLGYCFRQLEIKREINREILMDNCVVFLASPFEISNAREIFK